MKHLKITNEEYRAIDALSNGEAQALEVNASDYIWNKTAPQDPLKASSFDFGTALHTALLEPELFNDSAIVYTKTKSRETVDFRKFLDTQEEDKIILLESEYNKIRIIKDSALAHPAFSKYLAMCDKRETSIVTELAGVKVKIRPDGCNDELAFIADLKSAADLSDWRDTARWKNPLFKFNYGFTAAFYLEAYQEALQKTVNEYHFLATQKTVSGGKYPVSVITITRDELEMYGFIDRVYATLEIYKERKNSGDWVEVERFPAFGGFDDVSVSFEGEL